MFTTIIIPAIIIGFLGLLFGFGLSYASKKFGVKNNDERIDRIIEILPDANCAACGYTGCSAYAEAVVVDGEKCNLCSPGGAKVSKRISNIMGVEDAGEEQSYVARIMCSGDRDVAKRKYDYTGIQTCNAASLIYGGQAACRFGCLGFGDCIAACPFHAIKLVNGVAKVSESRCVGCGLCAQVCPKDIIKILPIENRYSVTCMNTDRGAAVRKICEQGCIGCRKCVKVCAKGAISMTDGLATIDPEKCVNCGMCLPECPTGAIKKIYYITCSRV